MVAIVESIEELQGQTIWGLEVVAPERLQKLNVTTILICTDPLDREAASELLGREFDGFEVETLFAQNEPAKDSSTNAQFEPSPVL